MAHSLIVGMSESGKTTLGKQLAAMLHSQGKNVLVLDPMNDPAWQASFRTSDPDQFLEVFWANQKCYVFIDEAGDVVGRYDDLMRQTATKGRHWGHSCTYITQRGAMIAATVRAQCRHLFLFTTPIDDCKALAKDFNNAELLKASQLPQFHFYGASRYAPLTRGVVSWSGTKS